MQWVNKNHAGTKVVFSNRSANCHNTFQNRGWKNTGLKKADLKLMANRKHKLKISKLSTKNIFHNESVLKNMS